VPRRTSQQDLAFVTALTISLKYSYNKSPAAEHAMPHRPREWRDRDRMRRAASANRSALDATLAEIATAFDEAARINAFKLRVERQLRLGPLHPAVRARFGARATLLQGRSLDAAIALVERWWRDERRAFFIASALGRGVRLPIDVLAELRLILRLMHFKRMQAQFPVIVAALCDESSAMAAE